MNGTRYRSLKAGSILMIVTVIGLYIAGGSYAQQHNHAMPGSMQPQAKEPKPVPESLRVIHSTRLPAVQEAVARAIRHLEAGHQEEALKEMRQIKGSLEALHQALGKHVGPLFINDRCPIMGTKINVERIPAELTRMHGEHKVGFCCGGCPAQWDRLPEAEKAARLQKVATGPQPPERGMQHQH